MNVDGLGETLFFTRSKSEKIDLKEISVEKAQKIWASDAKFLTEEPRTCTFMKKELNSERTSYTPLIKIYKVCEKKEKMILVSEEYHIYSMRVWGCSKKDFFARTETPTYIITYNISRGLGSGKKVARQNLWVFRGNFGISPIVNSHPSFPFFMI